jgi:hypothetical protein
VGADQCQPSPQTKEAMNHKVVKYGILLTREQLDFLKDDNQGFHRMKAFDTFLSLAAIEPFHYEKKNFSADLDIGQFAISKVELAELWHCDRKTAQKMIDLFNEVGILTSVANNRTTIHTIHCLAFWFVNGQNAPIRNPHYQRNPVTQKLAVQGNASSTSSNDNGNSHPQSLTSNNPVPSVAAANDDEREENKLSPYGEDGQLPEDYLEEIDEHYANLPPEADEPYSSSDDAKSGNTPSKPNNQEGIHIDEGSTALPASPIPNAVAADTTDTTDCHQCGDD